LPETRAWIAAQTAYARNYLDRIPGRAQIRERVRELLDVESFDSFLKAGNRYFFRKRLPKREQPCIYMRDGADGKDQLLLDPADRGTGSFTALKPLRVSPDGRLLLYEVKQGGERSGTFELFDLEVRRVIPDKLAHGYLRGFAFDLNGGGFYYAHEATAAKRPFYRAAYHHVLGADPENDLEVFCAGEDRNTRLCLISDAEHLGFLVYRSLDKTYTDFYLWRPGSGQGPEPILRNAEYSFAPTLLNGRLLALTDRDAPNLRIVEVCLEGGEHPVFRDLVPARDSSIRNWAIAADRIYVSYVRAAKMEVDIFTVSGESAGRIPLEDDDTVRLLFADPGNDELLFECESFARPVTINKYSHSTKQRTSLAECEVPFDSQAFAHFQVWFAAKDGARIPMFLVGRREVLEAGSHPAILTAYGGYGIPMTPRFSVLVAFLIERGCIFALPNIRGGSEFGADWHKAAKRGHRQVAIDDFLCAAEWLVQMEKTEANRLAIFGGSNSGLLVGAALTQRPDLFRAVLCMVPMLDMLRYHHFDSAHLWKDEFGTAEDPGDFAALRSYSPYHQLRDDTAYPATMIVSGDADTNCNPLHARKMTARLQTANTSGQPILLDYSKFRGHSPVLPLSVRVDALTDRLAFLCDQLGILV